MIHAAIHPLSGGCGSGELIRQFNAMGPSTRRGLTAIQGEDQKCFRDSVLCCLFSRKLYLEYVDIEEMKCKNHNRIFCGCRKLAEQQCLVGRKNGNYSFYFCIFLK